MSKKEAGNWALKKSISTRYRHLISQCLQVYEGDASLSLCNQKNDGEYRRFASFMETEINAELNKRFEKL
ncbi:aminoglycoside adenylyltransferase domain-containing protein [Tigheibacillus jepli]|uniref:aminoglycoside adenylyltransferase domain-containing protein n=1 Tax=Tigheibacillus jepli TaxID=3035914 RepID=UPI00387E0E0D